MSRTIVNVTGDANYSTDTSLTSIANLDTRNAIFYIAASGIRYGIIINVYRKNDSINYDKAELINNDINPIVTTYDNGYATMKGKIQLKNGETEVGNLIDFNKTFAVQTNVTSRSLVIDRQSSTISSIGSLYKRITIYATVHY